MNDQQTLERLAMAVDDDDERPAKLFEITALVSYSVVIAADNEKQALDYVSTWDGSEWDTNAEVVGVSDVDLFDVRDGTVADAHFVMGKAKHNNRRNGNDE